MPRAPLGYWNDIVKYKDRLLVYSIIGALFGYVGAELLLHVSDAQFSYAVPWLMLFAVVLFVFGGRINGFVTARSSGRRGAQTARRRRCCCVLLAGISVYGGFFNAGLGILLLAFLVLAGVERHPRRQWPQAVHFGADRARRGHPLRHSRARSTGTTAPSRWSASPSAPMSPPASPTAFPTRYIRALVIIYGAGLTMYFFWTTYFAG